MLINIAGMILMTGLLISVISNLLERRVDNLKNGRIYYKFKKHLIIIGYDKMTVSLIKQLSAKYPKHDIILQTIQNVPDVRHQLFSYLKKDIESNVMILSGNRNSKEDLAKLRPHEAKEIYVLGEYNEHDHDSLNIECIKKINNILKDKHLKDDLKVPMTDDKFNKLTEKNNIFDKPCYVLIENQSTYSILQQQDITEIKIKISIADNDAMQKKREETISLLEFLPFNFQELWAQKLFISQSYECTEDCSENITYTPLDREGISVDSDKTVHLVIIGMSKMGIALGIQATHLCHFPNFVRDNTLKTKITFIDEQADVEMNFLQGRYRHLFKEIDYSYESIDNPTDNFNNRKELNAKGNTGKFTDIEWHFIKGRIEHPKIQERLLSYSEQNTHLTIAICLNHPTAAIAAGLYLPDEVYQNDENSLHPNKDVQILIKQDTPHSILSMLKTTKKYMNVKPFGMLDNCLEVSNTDDLSARIIHYIYSYYFDEKTKGQIPNEIPSPETCEILWKPIPISHKWSNMYHNDMLPIKRRSFNMDALDEQIELIAEVEHNRWNIEKLLIGYRPTNPDEEKKFKSGEFSKKALQNEFIHTDIKSFEELSKSQQDIDRMISRALPLIIKYKNENV